MQILVCDECSERFESEEKFLQVVKTGSDGVVQHLHFGCVIFVELINSLKFDEYVRMELQPIIAAKG